MKHKITQFVFITLITALMPLCAYSDSLRPISADQRAGSASANSARPDQEVKLRRGIMTPEAKGVFSELVTKDAEKYDWKGHEAELRSMLVDLEIGLSYANGVIAFCPIKYFRFPWAIAGMHEANWHAKVIAAGVPDKDLQFVVELRKGGVVKYQLFQIGPEPRILIGINKHKGEPRAVLNIINVKRAEKEITRFLVRQAAAERLRSRHWAKSSIPDEDGPITSESKITHRIQEGPNGAGASWKPAKKAVAAPSTAAFLSGIVRRQRLKKAAQTLQGQILRARAFRDREADTDSQNLDLENFRQKVEGLIEQLYDSDDEMYCAAAARDLGNMREFKRYPDETAKIRDQAIEALGDHLPGYSLEDTDEESSIVHGAVVNALGGLGEIGPLDSNTEERLIHALRIAEVDLGIKEEILRVCAQIRFPGKYLLERDKLILSFAILYEKYAEDNPDIDQEEVIEVYLLCIRVLGNFSFGEGHTEPLDNTGSWGMLKHIGQTGSIRGEDNVEYSKRLSMCEAVYEEAIIQMKHVFDKTVEVLRREMTPESSFTAGMRGGYITAREAFSDTSSALFDIFRRSKAKDAGEEISALARRRAASTLKLIGREWLSVMDEIAMRYPEQVKLLYIHPEDIRKHIATTAAFYLHGEKRDEDPRVQALLLQMLAEFGNRDTVDSRELVGILTVEDQDVVREAKKTIIAIGDPWALNQMRDLAEEKRGQTPFFVIRNGVRPSHLTLGQI